jgi:hypothetical protein
MSITEFRCAYCDQPLDLENAKTNESGQAVHEVATLPKTHLPKRKTSAARIDPEAVP